MKFKCFVGIDISKKTLDVTLYDNMNQRKSKHIKVKNNQKGFEEIIKWLIKNGAGIDNTVICMEHTGIYGVDISVFLEKTGIAFSLVSPLHIKRSLGLIRGKNDKVDSFQISRFCYLHREELKLSKNPSKAIQELRSLLNERERVVKMLTVEKQILKEFEKASSTSTLNRTKARMLMFTKEIHIIEKEMKQVIAKNPEIKKNIILASSVVGIGLVNSVLFVIYSNNFEGFANGRKYAGYCGVAPFEFSSGTSIKCKAKVSHLANKRIKTNLNNAARSAVQNDPELRIYYQRKAAEGKEHGVIMNAIRFKLIIRVFAVIKRGSPYVKMRQAG